MNSFTVKGNADFVKVSLIEVFGFPNKTCPWGGYDVKARVEIKSGNFYVNSIFYSSTGEFYLFYLALKKCNTHLGGKVIYKNYEENFFLMVTYEIQGHVNINGTFSEENNLCNKLDYEFHTDQSYIRFTLEELEKIVNKYGDMKGIQK